MATTVVDNASNIQTYDTLVGFGLGNVGAPNAVITTYKVEGTGSVDGRITNPGRAGQGFDTGAANVDVSSLHVMQWVRTLDQVSNKSANGWVIRLSSSTDGTTNYKDITVGGEDTARIRLAGFNLFCCNGLRSGDLINGTVPAATAIRSFSVLGDHLSATTRFTWVMDQVKRISKITLTGGSSGTPGNSSDVASNDETNGRGLTILVEGTLYVTGGITIGDIVLTAVSHFTELSIPWTFRDQPVKNDFYTIEYVGNTDGINVATHGTKVGTGITARGVGGKSISSATATSPPVTILMTNTNIGVHYYGVPITNSLFEDHSFQSWEDNGGAFTNNTRPWNIATLTANLFPAVEANNDAFYISDRDRFFFGLEVVLGTPGVIGGGAISLAFEYHNGTAWVALPNISDGTANFTSSGRITWAKPDDASSVTVNAVAGYYMRVRIVSGTYSTTNPIGDTVRPLHAGLFKVEQTNAEILSCPITGMGPITIRNNPVFRGNTIINSNAGRMGGTDWGASDPTADNVRDNTHIGGEVGIVLKPIAVTTYNFRNEKFSGQSVAKVRIESTSRAITINVLNGGDNIANPADLDLFGGIVAADVTIVNNTVNTTVTVLDGRTSPPPVLQNARVLIEASDATGDLPFDDTVTITRATTTATVAHTAHGMASGDKVVIRKATQQEYNGVFVISNVSANAYDYTVAGSPTTPATGTIKATGVVLEGLTDVTGKIEDIRSWTLAQPVKGVVRKSTGSPRFKSAPIVGTVSTTAGLPITVQLVSDE